MPVGLATCEYGRNGVRPYGPFARFPFRLYSALPDINIALRGNWLHFLPETS